MCFLQTSTTSEWEDVSIRPYDWGSLRTHMWVAHKKNSNSRVYYKTLFKQFILNRKMCSNRMSCLIVSHIWNPWRDNTRLTSISFVLLSSSRFSSNNITGICYVYNTRNLYCSTHAVTSEKIACYLLLGFFFSLIRELRTLLLSCVCTISNWLLTNTKVRFKTQFCLI